MLQGISSDNSVIKENSLADANKNNSAFNFSAVLENANVELSDREEAVDSAYNKETFIPEEKTESLAEKFKEMTSKTTICKKCASMYWGTEIETCTKCGNDIKSQDQSSQTSESGGQKTGSNDGKKTKSDPNVAKVAAS